MDPADIRICFVGDSFVLGIGDPEALGWVGRLVLLSRQPGVEITAHNLGIRRDTSEDVGARWEVECRRRLPPGADNRIVFSFGVNDTTVEDGGLRVDRAGSTAATRAILSAASGTCKTLMIGPPPIGDSSQNQRIRDLDAVFQAVCGELALPYLSVVDDLLAEPVWMAEVSANDGAHPRAAGYGRFARLVRSWDAWWFRLNS